MERAIPRRTLLASCVLALSACGSSSLTVGQPSTYTPPPPGIDDLVRTDVLAALGSALALAEACNPTDLAAEPAHTAAIERHTKAVRAALREHGLAFHTGAENVQAKGSFAPSKAPATAASPAASLQELVSALGKLRDLHALNCLQVSDSLAQLSASAGAWAAWALTRYATLAAALNVPLTITKAPSGKALAPARKVPSTDPPTEAHPDTARALLPKAQENEYFAAYASEVIAAHRPAAARKAALGIADAHARRAESYGKIAALLSQEPVTRKAGYPLPFNTPSAGALKGLETDVTLTSVTDAIALTGAVAFAQRAILVEAWLTASEQYASLAPTLEALPALAERE